MNNAAPQKNIKKTGIRTIQHSKFRYKTNGWSPERRMKHARAIRRWRPWARSTGPRTVEGKARASRNAIKHGLYGRPGAELRQFLRDHRRFIKAYRQYRKGNPAPLLAFCLAVRSVAEERVFNYRGRRAGSGVQLLLLNPPENLAMVPVCQT